jgi:hypothetical protein
MTSEIDRLQFYQVPIDAQISSSTNTHTTRDRPDSDWLLVGGEMDSPFIETRKRRGQTCCKASRVITSKIPQGLSDRSPGEGMI